LGGRGKNDEPTPVRDMMDQRRVELRLEAAAREWRLTFDAMSDAVSLFGPDDRIVRCNSAAAEMTGLAFAEIVGRRCHEVFHRTDDHHPDCPLARARETRSAETATIDQDGRLLKVTVTPIYDADGFYTGGVHVVSDVTDLAEAEARLRTSERDLLAAERIAHMGSWSYDLENGSLKWSAELYRLMDIDPGAGLSTAERSRSVHPDDREQVEQVARYLLRGEEPPPGNYRIVRRDGSVHHIHMRTELRINGGGHRTLFGMNQDVTEQVLAEQALRESEARFRRIVETAAEGIILLDADFNVVFCNKRFADMLGYPVGDLVGKYADFWLFPEDHGELRRREANRRRGKTEQFERRMRRADGTEMWTAISGAPFMAADGAFEGSLAMISDITEPKRVAQRLERAVESTVGVMSTLVETRDPYTAGHQKLVTELAVAIAREMGIDEAEIVGLRLAGRVHDIGKIAVPAEILTKPSRLSEVEFSLIKEHSRVAYEILSPIDFGYPVADIVVQHHERLDGSGYPAGLTGDQTLLAARILAVADVVEAMASHRPYRPALGLDAALDEVRQGSGRLYDAEVVAACERVFDAGFTFSE
jgi:PAS domain S-box-containing protein/putative nucleotidyltransferase with HDIG domain